MRVLLIGSGGREHALAWKLRTSPRMTQLFCAPGNAGIAELATCVPLDLADHAAVLAFCRDQAIEFVIVGPEAPLVAGLVDELEAAGIRTFGPTKDAARLEGSKGFTKDLCRDHAIPTAAYARFSSPGKAKAYVRERGAPIVVKADGLAAGKGVTVATTEKEALRAIDRIFGGTLCDNMEVVIEEMLVGEEASFFVLADGLTALPLATAQDHKRAYDGDQGPNTGGMGAYSPAPVMTEAMIARTMDEIIHPTLKAMAQMGCPFRGVLYAGLMITERGPQLIEYNVRFGDPECQALMMRLKSDLLEVLHATCDGTLGRIKLDWSEGPALTVVMAAKGYPDLVETGTVIQGLDAAGTDPDVAIFHAGTARRDGALVAAGGRVLGVTARGATIALAREKAYAAVDRIDWPGGFCRRDIGWRAIGRKG